MTTRTVTGTLLEGDGTAWASGSVVFTLQSSIALDGTSTYPMYTVTATTDGSGNFSTALAVPASGAYLWACTLPDSRSFTFALEAGSSVNINTLIADANLDAATDAGAMAALLTAYLPLAGGTMTAPLLFSGTTHAGIAVISLTTVQRDAIASPATGAIIWNTTASELQYYSGAAWATVGASHDAVTLAGSLDYLTITGQAITRGAIDLTTDVTGDLPVADGGTGASTAADARTNLGLVIGTNVQAQDAELAAIAALAVTDGNIIVGDGATWVAESGATARTSLGLGTGNSPQFTAVNVGSADTTLARVSAGVLSVEGVTILTVAGGTLTGGLGFSGTTHAGVTLNNLTTAQREALTPVAGMLVWDTDDNCVYWYSNEWIQVSPSIYLLKNSNLSDIGSPISARQNIGIVQAITIACSDETTALTTGAAKATFRMPYAMTVTAVRASVTTAPTGSTLVVDINEGGVSILSTKLSIDATEKTSVSAATAAVISDTELDDDDEITIDIDQVGSTIAGAGLKVTLIGWLA